MIPARLERATHSFEGVVLWFNEQKGYGFISYGNEFMRVTADIFVHVSGLLNGTNISADTGATEKGCRCQKGRAKEGI